MFNGKLEMNKNTPLEFGLYSLGDHLLNPLKGEKVSYEQRINEIIEASKLADEAGIDVLQLVKVIRSILQHRHIRLC